MACDGNVLVATWHALCFNNYQNDPAGQMTHVCQIIYDKTKWVHCTGFENNLAKWVEWWHSYNLWRPPSLKLPVMTSWPARNVYITIVAVCPLLSSINISMSCNIACYNHITASQIYSAISIHHKSITYNAVSHDQYLIHARDVYISGSTYSMSWSTSFLLSSFL